jgi:hypothetical protein
MGKQINEAERAPLAERGLDLYSTCYPALAVLLQAEGSRLPKQIIEPCCGPGALVIPLRAMGYAVRAYDIVDWGCPDSYAGYDVRDMEIVRPGWGIVTNPPFQIAYEAANAMLTSAHYVALFLRLQFLESEQRHGWFEHMGLSRLHIITDRLPMMHRYGWEGNKIGSSRMAYCWFVFDRRHGRQEGTIIKWWRWKDCVKQFPAP